MTTYCDLDLDWKWRREAESRDYRARANWFFFGLDSGRVQPASHFHCYQELRKSGAVSDLAVCDSSNEALQRAAGSIVNSYEGTSIHVYRSVDSMLNVFHPEIVSICAPTNTHAGITKQVAACSSVKTIFLEKPIAQSLKEADEILLACRTNNINLAVNYSRRWSSIYKDLKFRNLKNFVGVHTGPLLRTGTHMIDLFNMVCYTPNEPVTVQAFGSPYMAEYMETTEDFNINGFILYGMNRKAPTATLIGVLESVPQDTVIFEIDAFGFSERVRITQNGYRTEFFDRTPSDRFSKLNEYHLRALVQNRSENCLLSAIEELVTLSRPQNVGSTVIVNNYVSCTGYDARLTLQVALGLHYSATHGNKPVKLDDVPYDYTVRSY